MVKPETFEWHAVGHPGDLGHDPRHSASEHRDTQAIHAKLDEVLHALGDARNELTRITRESLEEIGDHVSTCAKAIKPCSTSGSAVTQKTIGGGSKRNGRRPMAAVRKYVNAFNRGDATAMATTFAGSGSILDGMAPHVWQGPTATQDWYKGFLVEGKQHDVSDHFISLGEPLHNVTGDSAYAIRRSPRCRIHRV